MDKNVPAKTTSKVNKMRSITVQDSHRSPI